jgi:MFS transporter, DHA2 family, multidrug resistance protein
MNGSGPRRWWALGALVLSAVVVGIDVNVLAVALPTLASALHASTAQLQWFVDAYTLVGAATLLPAGMLGDRFGRRRVLLLALGLFGIASAGCAFATTSATLIGARAVLGLAAAFILPLAIAVVPVIFSPSERPRAIAIVASANIASLPLGPILGGWLLTNFWWGSVFLINLPVVVVAMIAVARLMPESRGSTGSAFDAVGIGVSSLGLAALVFGVITAGESGWTAPTTLATLLLGVLLLVGFVVWERRRVAAGEQPLVDLGLFRSPGFTWGTLLATLVTFAMFGMSFTTPQYFQAVRGADALGVGLRMIPMVLGLLVGLLTAQRTVSRVGATAIAAVGFLILGAALLAGSATTVSSGDAFVLAWVTAMGLGLGFAMPTTINAAMSALTVERAGSGSALMMAVRQVGGAFGVAILGSVLNVAYRSRLDVAALPAAAAQAAQRSVFGGLAVAREAGSAALGNSVRLAFVGGMDVLLVVCSVIAVVAAVLAVAFLPGATPEPTSVAADRREASSGLAVE